MCQKFSTSNPKQCRFLQVAQLDFFMLGCSVVCSCENLITVNQAVAVNAETAQAYSMITDDSQTVSQRFIRKHNNIKIKQKQEGQCYLLILIEYYHNTVVINLLNVKKLKDGRADGCFIKYEIKSVNNKTIEKNFVRQKVETFSSNSTYLFVELV